MRFDASPFIGSVFLTFVLLLLTGSLADAAPLRVRVRGTAKLVARATRDQIPIPTPPNTPPQTASELVLSGSLADDAGQPLAFQSVTVRVRSETDPHDVKVGEGLLKAHGCDRNADGSPTPGAGRRGPNAFSVRASGPTDGPDVIVMTDDEGRFCFRARIEPARYKATLVFTPPTSQSGLVDGLEKEIIFDLTKRSLALRFDPTPKIIQLDTPRTTIEAVAIVDDDANPRVAPLLSLVLANEKEEIARAVTDASGRGRFILPGAKLGPPGQGELHVSFAGDGETSRASQSEDIERHVKVAVKVPTAERGELSPGVPEDGIPLVAEVTSSVGPLTEGSIEAHYGEVVVGAAPVERGIARLTLTFAAQGTEALVRLRYVPASPWYEPLSEPVVRVPIRGPSLLSKAPILLAGLAVLAFFLVGRVSGQKNKPEPVPALADGPGRDAKPRLDVIKTAERGQGGWIGRVVDAHEGMAVRGVRVWIERGTFDGRIVLASVETDNDGKFTLAAFPIEGGEVIAAEGRLYSRFTQDLPPAGEIAIALAARRRALLARMVKWAKRKGPPFDQRPEPTPGHVRRAASGDFGTARWADAIERAVFGPGEIDARAENEVDRLAPEERPGEAPAGQQLPRDIGRRSDRKAPVADDPTEK